MTPPFRSPLSQATGDMRRALKLTVEQFAEMLAVSRGTVARCEDSQSPAGIYLARLQEVAQQLGLTDFEPKFQAALLKELGQWDTEKRKIVVL